MRVTHTKHSTNQEVYQDTSKSKPIWEEVARFAHFGSKCISDGFKTPCFTRIPCLSNVYSLQRWSHWQNLDWHLKSGHTLQHRTCKFQLGHAVKVKLWVCLCCTNVTAQLVTGATCLVVPPTGLASHERRIWTDQRPWEECGSSRDQGDGTRCDERDVCWRPNSKLLGSGNLTTQNIFWKGQEQSFFESVI